MIFTLPVWKVYIYTFTSSQRKWTKVVRYGETTSFKANFTDTRKSSTRYGFSQNEKLQLKCLFCSNAYLKKQVRILRKQKDWKTFSNEHFRPVCFEFSQSTAACKLKIISRQWIAFVTETRKEVASHK